MLNQGNITFAEARRLLRQYWWVFPVASFTLAAVGFLATMVLPKKYTSSTMVLVEPPAISSEVVPDAVNQDLYRHLASMKEQIVSRSRLQSIIVKFNLFPNKRSSTHMEDLVENLKKMIEVELIQPMVGSENRQPPGFHVTVTLNDPQLAQQVCTEITSMFMEQNSTTIEDKLKGTEKFLTQQLAEAKTNLDEQDARLAQFKREHLGTLPEESAGTLNLLTSMNSQLEATTQALSRAQQDKTFNESLLNQQEASMKAQPTPVVTTDALETQLATLQEQLSGLLAKYTPEHPDVVKTKAQIEDVKRRMAAKTDTKETASDQPPVHETPQMQLLRAKIKQGDQSITDLSKHQADIQQQIAVLQSHIQQSPIVEQQIKELTRNYQTALDNYNDLLKKQQKSAMLTDLQDQQQGETFRVLDAPSLPSSPSFPKKSIFTGGGFAAGLVLAFGIVYLLAVADKALYTERDVEACLKLPVLTIVPSFEITEPRKELGGVLVAKV